MNLRIHDRSIRSRIALWHLGFLTFTLGAYIISTQISLWHQLTAEIKANLQEEAEEIATLFLKPGPDGQLVWRDNQDDMEKEYMIAVSSLDGFPIFQNFSTTDVSLPLVSAASSKQAITFHTVRLPDDTKLLIAQEIRKISGVNVVIRVGRSTTVFFKEMHNLLLVQALCFPVVLLLAWAGSYFVAGRVLLPLQKIIARMKALTAERLHEQLPVENANDELGHLSITFNHLLGQLNHSFTQMRQFTGDASHELRTPLAAMHIVGEAALRSPRSVDEYKDTISSMLEEVDKMSHLVSDLLALTRADSNAVQLKFKKLELSEVVKEEMARLEVLTEEKEQKLSLTVKKTCSVCLDQNIFRQAFANILFNAIQYSPQSTSVEILVDKTEEFCYVEIIDSGPGIAPEHQTRIFDRFFRVDKVRSRDTGGSGLGLAIAQWAVEKHGGRIDLTSMPNQGSTFRISLPVQNQEHCPSAFKPMERSPLIPWPKQTGTS